MFEALQNPWLFAAGITAGLSAVIHVFVGGPEIARPLLESKDIPDIPKYVAYYCWHLVTLTISAMSIGLIWPAYDSSQTGLAWMWAAMAVLFTLWSIALILWKRQGFWQMPQWALFLIIAVLAVIGLLG